MMRLLITLLILFCPQSLSWQNSDSLFSQKNKARSGSVLSMKINKEHDVSESKKGPIYSYFLEHNTNVHVSKTKVPPNIWNSIVPSALTYSLHPDKKSSTPGLIVTSLFPDPQLGAEQLLFQCGITPHSTSPNRYKDALDHLEQALDHFKKVITEVYGDTVELRAKIIATRGPDGIKCPKWHVDHVPIRLILALEGPGVCYLTKSNSLQQNESNQMNYLFKMVNLGQETDATMENRSILNKYKNHKEMQAKTGEIVLLMGKVWEKKLKYDANIKYRDTKSLLSGALHKSPEIPAFQGRVLLTVDAIIEDDFDAEVDSDRKIVCDCEQCL